MLVVWGWDAGNQTDLDLPHIKNPASDRCGPSQSTAIMWFIRAPCCRAASSARDSDSRGLLGNRAARILAWPVILVPARGNVVYDLTIHLILNRRRYENVSSCGDISCALECAILTWIKEPRWSNTCNCFTAESRMQMRWNVCKRCTLTVIG